MLKPPKVPLVYRAAAITVALVIAACTLQVYVFGAKFAGAVANYARMSAQQAADDEAKAKRSVADRQRFKDPGVVGVQIIDPDKKK